VTQEISEQMLRQMTEPSEEEIAVLAEQGVAPSATAMAVEMAEMLSGFQRSQALYVVAKLDLAAKLLDGPRSAPDLAAEVGAEPDHLARLMHVLSGYGVFTHSGDGRYTITELGATLASGTPGSVRGLAMMWMETCYAPYDEFLDVVRTGRTAPELHSGVPFFESIAGDQTLVDTFGQAMADIVCSIQLPTLQAYELPPGDVVADIGGADGTVLAELIVDRPERRGIRVDLPQAVGASAEVLERMGLTDRVEVVGMDFFASGLPRADVYVLSKVLHDWDDDACLRLLDGLVRAAPGGSSVVVIDTVVPEGDAHSFGKIHELTMLGITSGRERTGTEYRDLLSRAGIAVDRVVDGPEGGFSVVEATIPTP
jgi:hypothetical protein